MMENMIQTLLAKGGLLMSRGYEGVCGGYATTPSFPCGMGMFGGKNCCCSLPTLIILILIILQFSKKARRTSSSSSSSSCGEKLVDNSILFIIALFYLSCCNPCKTSAY